jgi:tight adherence protein B
MRALTTPVSAAERRRLRLLTGLGPADTRIAGHERLLALIDRHPRRVAWLCGLLAALVTGAAEGPVAALVAGVYAGGAIAVVASVRRSRARTRAAAVALDLVAAIAADLRAGADPAIAMAAHLPAVRATGRPGQILADRISAASRVAETVGARLADLLERLEADARALGAAQARAEAQAAGAQATAWLLAALPIAGLALGFGIGVNPVHVLFHTKPGAACAVAALGFQVAGLAWTGRLAASIVDSAQ